MSVRPSDIDIYVLRHTAFKHLSRPDAVKRIADVQEKTRGGVSGALSRATGTVDAKQALINYMSQNIPQSTPATREIKQIVAEGQTREFEHRSRLKEGKLARAAFVSDIHFPEHDPAALELTYKILDDYQPDFLSAGNDDQDFAELSHWVDRRGIKERGISADISHTTEITGLHYELLYAIVPNMLAVYVGANHNKRIATYSGKGDSAVTSNNPQMRDVMKRLNAAGVTFLNDMSVENLYFLNPRLAWFHGQSASVNSKTVLKNNYRNAKRQLKVMRLPSREFSLIYGHTHRMSTQTYDKIIDIRGYNSGCLCRMDMDYLKHGNDWVHGIVLSDFDPTGDYHHTRTVEYVHDYSHHKMIAQVNGKTYSVDME